jgi:hypothetical protein
MIQVDHTGIAAHDALASVPWSSFGDPTGDPSRVPALLRALSSPDVAGAGDAPRDLLPHIWDQGSLFECTAHVVPFLVGALARRSQPRRDRIALLLGLIADAGVEGRATNAACVEPSREAVARGLPVYLGLVSEACSDGPRALCSALLYLLCHFHEERSSVLEVVRPCLAGRHEDDFARLERILTQPSFERAGARALLGLSWPSPRFWAGVEAEDPRAASLPGEALARLWEAETLALLAYMGARATHWVTEADRGAR